jgi:hypothetical protein
VRPSNIAGRGLFATSDLPPNRIIISYIGTIASTFTANLTSNSLFTLGWITSDPPRELLITPEYGTNAGRYINSSDRHHPANCKPHIGVLDNNEVAVYFYTLKSVSKDEELLFNYGNLYDFSIKSCSSLQVIVEKGEEIFESD